MFVRILFLTVRTDSDLQNERTRRWAQSVYHPDHDDGESTVGYSASLRGLRR